MLIDLLDKKALEENNLDALERNIHKLSLSPGNGTKITETLNIVIGIANKIRNYNLLIHDAKDSIKITLSEQEFNLNTIDYITDAIADQIRVIDIVIDSSPSDIDLSTLLNSRTALQAELNTINKASDKAIWKAELVDG